MVDCSSEILFVQFSIDYQMKTVQGVAPIQILAATLQHILQLNQDKKQRDAISRTTQQSYVRTKI